MVLLLALTATGAAPLGAQAPPWRLVADGDTVAWAPLRPVPADSAEAAAAHALAYLQGQGFLLARIDSAAVGDGLPTLFATRGPRPVVADLRLTGTAALDAEAFLDTAETRAGRPYDPAALDRDLDALLVRYERLGYPLAQVRPALTLIPAGEAPAVDIALRVVEGRMLRLLGVELDGARRTSGRYAARVAGLTPGRALVPYAPADIRADLEATGLFASVGPPSLVLADSGAVVRVPVEEGPPGVFDLVLGYLPPAEGRDGSVVGNGRIELRNLFGGGRLLRLRLVRNPGLASEVEVRAADPFVLGLPLSLEGAFDGYTQDSTFARSRFRAEVGYGLAPGLALLASVSREQVEPGFFGAQTVEGRPRVAASRAVFGGVGLRYRRLDHPFAPRRGLWVEALVEQGLKRRSLPADTAGFAEPVSVRQQRLLAAGRLFVPLLRRQSLVVGGEASVLLGGRAAGGDAPAVYDEGDLFRFGGAASLRGYDEDRFAGRVVARALAEVRYRLDRTSFAFAFADLGYLDRPPLPGLAAETSWLPGYGAGVQYATPLGLVTVTYALSPDLGPSEGKVHVGLSVGL
ncbi:MAG: BamA/TamA family outer membrane protein [Rubricoccaceae bacterium]|nr:BamA/TamA family outer membrane protein [Rubricoccaceae bacterium]